MQSVTKLMIVIAAFALARRCLTLFFSMCVSALLSCNMLNYFLLIQSFTNDSLAPEPQAERERERVSTTGVERRGVREERFCRQTLSCMHVCSCVCVCVLRCSRVRIRILCDLRAGMRIASDEAEVTMMMREANLFSPSFSSCRRCRH